MNIAAAVRKEREQFPERFCRKCLWREQTRHGYKPCPCHSEAERKGVRVRGTEASVESAPRPADSQSASRPTPLLAPPATPSRNHDADCQCKLCDVAWIL